MLWLKKSNHGICFPPENCAQKIQEITQLIVEIQSQCVYNIVQVCITGHCQAMIFVVDIFKKLLFLNSHDIKTNI
jgi:hypothetical protein